MSVISYETDMPHVQTPLGPGRVLFIETSAFDNEWTCIITKTLAIVSFKQKRLRWGRNYTDGFGIDDETMKTITGDTK